MHVDETLLVERLGIDDRRIDVRENLEFARAADVVAIARRSVRHDLGLIPIGDRFTMGPETAALACNEFLDLEVIVPIHWGTFDLLSGHPDQFAPLVKRGKVVLPKPGETLEI
jgi:L-ascorbate metabolism protein UlaG (beta-lactamase superfamily)